MARIRLEGVGHALIRRPGRAEDFVVQPLDLDWRDGTAIAVAGDPDSGAATLLQILGGFVRPLRGRILFDGRDVTGLSPRARGIAQVFRAPVVYPAMTVADNLGFPLRNRGVPAAQRAVRVGEIAELLELTAVLGVRAGTLDTATRQAVTLGRALVPDDLVAVLLDDPFGLLTPADRGPLRRLMRRAQAARRRTFVYSLEALADAASVADEVVVFEAGRILQAAVPGTILDDPVAPRVGALGGSDGMNLIPVAIVDGVPRFAGRPLAASTPEQVNRWLGAQQSASPLAALRLGIRPECVALARPGDPGSIEADLERVRDLGPSMLITARIGETRIRASVPVESEADAALALLAGAPVAAGRRIHLSIVNPDSRFFRDEDLIR